MSWLGNRRVFIVLTDVSAIFSWLSSELKCDSGAAWPAVLVCSSGLCSYLGSYTKNIYGEKVFSKTKKFSQLRKKKATRLSQLAFLQRCRDKNIVPNFIQVQRAKQHLSHTSALRKATRRWLKRQLKQ